MEEGRPGFVQVEEGRSSTALVLKFILAVEVRKFVGNVEKTFKL